MESESRENEGVIYYYGITPCADYQCNSICRLGVKDCQFQDRCLNRNEVGKVGNLLRYFVLH